jgi:hypothetical protein
MKSHPNFETLSRDYTMAPASISKLVKPLQGWTPYIVGVKQGDAMALVLFLLLMIQVFAETPLETNGEKPRLTSYLLTITRIERETTG